MDARRAARRLIVGMAMFVALCVTATARADEPAAAADAEIARLIAEMGDDDYFVRERAQAELEKIGFDAFDALTAATTNDDLEIAIRARYLLRLMRIDTADKNDPPEVKKLLTDYERQPREQKLARMQALAELPDGAGLSALSRLVRYERSALLSKLAAIAMLGRPSAKGAPQGKAADAIRAGLARSARAPARWLTTWLRATDEPQAALDEWVGHIAAERKLLDSGSNETEPEIVAGLIRFQIEWFKQRNENERAVAAMRQLIDLEPGEPERLIELMQWLIDQKAWKVIDEVAERFDVQFKQHAPLMYALAQAQAAQGNRAAADETAAAALKLNPGPELTSLILHLRTAIELRNRGMVDWAVREYRHVIDASPEGHPIAANARFGLAELHHDQAQDLEAGKLLEEVLASNKQDGELGGRSRGEVTSRMHYFFARHHESKNEPGPHRERLLKGLAVEEPDIDLLIAINRLADLTPDERKSVDAKIKGWAELMLQAIGNDPNNPLFYNQYAWLVGNTSRVPAELDAALKYSQRSLELSPNNGGYLDTLAHVHFARGEYEEAVRVQTKAAEADPHLGHITRQLEVFKARLAEKQKAEKQNAEKESDRSATPDAQ